MKTTHAFQKHLSFTSIVKAIFFISFFSIAIFAFYSCNKIEIPGLTSFKQTKASVATDWYHLQISILTQRNSALVNNVTFAYVGIGLYEAVRYDIPFSVSFSTKLYHMPAMPGIEAGKNYNWEESANAALASLVRSLYFSLTPDELARIDSLEKAWNTRLKNGVSNEVFARSQNFGRSIATAVYNWSLVSEANFSNAGYIAPVCPGCWIPTPPAFVNPPVLPYVGQSHTLLASNYNTVTPPYPAPYSENPKSSYYKVVLELYNISKTLTDDQKNTALYWVDLGNGVGVTVGGHDMSIATQVIEQTHACLGQAAEAYAKAGIAERDGVIECFKAKYKYTTIRPVSYIQRVLEPGWQSFIPTPPHPEYPAAHAAVTGSVMAALTGVFGDNVSFTDRTYEFRGWPARTFNYIFAAAEQAGISRLYGGIHYRPSIEAGLKLAKEVGGRVGEIKLHDIQF